MEQFNPTLLKRPCDFVGKKTDLTFCSHINIFGWTSLYFQWSETFERIPHCRQNMTDWVSFGSCSFSSKYKLTFIPLSVSHAIPPQHWKLTFTAEFGCVSVLFKYMGPSVRKAESRETPVAS